MRKTIFLLAILTVIISGCVTGPEGYMKRSANNRLFDTKGFKRGKRAPLYNKKYIAQAKKNVASGMYDDDEDSDDPYYEEEDVPLANREVYRQMLKEELEESNKHKSPWSFFNNRKPKPLYPVTAQAGYIMSYEENNEKLKAEIEKLKGIINQTKKEFNSSKCQIDIPAEANEISATGGDNIEKNVNNTKGLENERSYKNLKPESIEIDPVHSI